MKIFSAPAALVALGVCIILHVAAVCTPERASRILNYVNIGLHVVLVAVLAISGLTIEESVLAYLISLFVYTSASAIRYKLDAQRTARLAALEESFAASRKNSTAGAEEGEV